MTLGYEQRCRAMINSLLDSEQEIARMLAYARIHAGITIQEAARLAKLTVADVYKCESDGGACPFNHVARLATIYGVPVAYLV